MIWTKLKKLAEALLADSLTGRVHYHAARYGKGVSYFMSRGWVTLDRVEIANFSTIKRYVESFRQFGEWWPSSELIQEQLNQQGWSTRNDFVAALETLVASPVDVALVSPDTVLRALALFDRRLGQRRLRSLTLTKNEQSLVQLFFNIRCQAEGIEVEAGR